MVRCRAFTAPLLCAQPLQRQPGNRRRPHAGETELSSLDVAALLLYYYSCLYLARFWFFEVTAVSWPGLGFLKLQQLSWARWAHEHIARLTKAIMTDQASEMRTCHTHRNTKHISQPGQQASWR